MPFTVPLTPIFLNFAPGAPALVAMLEQMNAIELGQPAVGDPWIQLLTQGVTYGLGANLAIELWRPVLAEQHAKRVQKASTAGHPPVKQLIKQLALRNRANLGFHDGQ